MGDHTPSSAQMPSPPSSSSISVSINTATRKQHTELNRLVSERLSLALPPKASDPAILGRGLGAFAQIFFAFEEVWQQIEDGKHAMNKYDPDKAHGYDVCAYLAFLRPTGLGRGERLRKDLAHVRTRTGVDVRPYKYDEALAARVRHHANENPHVLIAYAWVMYMATFSGGRYIRQQLASAGPEFWLGAEQSGTAELEKHKSMPGFTFLSFDGEQDGEDIKADFKGRLEEAEALLTAEEKRDIVETAQGLFDECIRLVQDLSKRVERQSIGPLVSIAVLLAALFLALIGLFWFDNYSYLK